MERLPRTTIATLAVAFAALLIPLAACQHVAEDGGRARDAAPRDVRDAPQDGPIEDKHGDPPFDVKKDCHWDCLDFGKLSCKDGVVSKVVIRGGPYTDFCSPPPPEACDWYPILKCTSGCRVTSDKFRGCSAVSLCAEATKHDVGDPCECDLDCWSGGIPKLEDADLECDLATHKCVRIAEPAPEPALELAPEPVPEPPLEKPCADTCTFGDRRCGPDGHLQFCVKSGTGCPAWRSEWCTCSPALPPPMTCECPAAPAACAGVTKLPGTVCAGERALATCDTDEHGCVVLGPPKECPWRQICRTVAGVAKCACAPDQTDPAFDPATRYVAGTGCTATERDSTDPKVNTACDPVSGQVVKCKLLGSGATACNVWVAQPPCLAGDACTTDGTKPDGTPVSAPRCD